MKNNKKLENSEKIKGSSSEK